MQLSRGGLAISLVGTEISSGQLSGAFSYIQGKFSNWFKPFVQPQVPTVSQSPEKGIFEGFQENIKKFFELVQEFFQTWVKNLQQDLKGFSLFSTQNGQVQQQQEAEVPKKNWKEFVKGLFILLGFTHRNVFRVEFGAFPYLLLNLLVDTEKWSWSKEGITTAYQELNERFKKGLTQLLVLLIQLNETAKVMGKQASQKNRQYPSLPIPVKRSNIKWLGYSMPWVNVTQGDEQKR